MSPPKSSRNFPSITTCSGSSYESIAADLDGTLLISSSSLPYFMLVAIEAGSLFRGLILLLSLPIVIIAYLFISEALGIQMLIFISFSGLKVRDIELAARAVLPRFYAANVRSESFEVFDKCKRKVVVTANPTIMVEPFVKDFLGGDKVLGTEIEVNPKTKKATGFVKKPGVLVGKHKRLAILKEFGEEAPDLGIGDRESDHDFMSICTASSKLFRKELKRELFFNNGGGESLNHVVSLTSSTYGVLNLDDEKPIKECVSETKKLQRSPPPHPPRSRREEPEVINAWELMEGLEEEGIPIPKKSPKPRVFLRGFTDFDSRLSPAKFSGSPKKAMRFSGKENKGRVSLFRSDCSPKRILKSKNFSENSCKAVLNFSYPVKGSPIGAKKVESPGSNLGYLSRRQSYSPPFDPELVANYERELSEEEEQIKRMVSPNAKLRRARNTQVLESSLLHSFVMKCPPGGENAVVIYTTTLRGIRKTFEDCNKVRSIIESYCIQVLERDISMDSGLKEELRGLMGTKDVRVPLVFVKGRLIGGVDEVVKLEEEGKLSLLFDGIPRALGGCEGCAGVRFVMCMNCSGSCKVLDVEQKKMVRCGGCNENGLIQCPICC